MHPKDESANGEVQSSPERDDQGGQLRRRPWYFRLAAHLPIRFQVLNGEDSLGPELAGMTQDLGEQGLGFIAKRLPGEVLAVLRGSARDQLAIVIRLGLPGREIRLSGKVRWIHPIPNRSAATIGVNFVDYEPADVLEMLRFSEILARRRQVLRAVASTLAALSALLLLVWALW